MSAPNNPYDPVAVSTLEPEAVDAMVQAALAAIAEASDLESLKEVRLAHAGDRSPLALANREIGALPPAAKAEAGDILIPIEAGELTYDHVAGELGEVLLERVPGRQHGTDITIFKSVGLAMQDAVTAAKVYAKAVEEGVGQQVEL